MNADETYQAGLELLREGDTQAVVDLALESLTSYPNDGRLWEILGVARSWQNEHSQASAALETASLLKPLDIAARFCLAGSFAQTGRDSLAVFLFQLVGDDPETPQWLLPRVASRLGQLGAHHQALQVCRRIAQADPYHHESRFGTGYYLRRTGAAVEEAAAAIEEAHRLAPEVDLYRIVLAGLWRESGRVEEACELLRELRVHTVRCPCSLRQMMQVFQAAGDSVRSDACQSQINKLKEKEPPCGGDR